MFVVSKRSFKRAVKRNLIRRHMREVFRLNVHTIFDSIPENKRVDIALIFVSKDIVETPVIEKSVNELLHKLKTKLKVE
jgi:ribonuclease P protein component